MKIFYVPIEPIDTRYTADWIEQFILEFTKAKAKYEVILPKESTESSIKNGDVLDTFNTSFTKLSQLNILVNYINLGLITDEDVILFADAWFPGLETLFYIRNMMNMRFKIAGIFHAGSYDPYDFTSRHGMRHWAQHQELAWLNGLDIIFVATQWHKDLIVMNSGVFNEDKIFVTGLPFYGRDLALQYKIPDKKENIVVFPHRMDPEKHPERFERLKRKFPQWSFIYTLKETKNRKEYFELLARAKVMISFADQETFGYSTLECMALGVRVIVPNKLSYREVVPKMFRYNKEKEISSLLENFMNTDSIPEYSEITKWENSIPNMLQVIKFKLREFAKIRKAEELLEQREQERIAQEKEERRLKQIEKKEEAKKQSQSGGTEND